MPNIVSLLLYLPSVTNIFILIVEVEKNFVQKSQSAAGMGEYLNHLAYVTKSDKVLGLHSNTEKSQSLEEEMRKPEFKSWVMARGSMLNRLSFCGPPPPPPPKDDVRPGIRNLDTGDSGDSGRAEDKPLPRSHFSDWVDRPLATPRSTASPVRKSRPSTRSEEIRIHFQATTRTEMSENTLERTMFTPHPLAMSPPSITLSPPTSPTPTRPSRPTRPPSIRLLSLAREGGLTTDRVVRLDLDRPGTSQSFATQPHTGYTSNSTVGNLKYGRGKYATTELVPQPSDDPQDPLNWQTWRKELNFHALLITATLCCVMKTILFSVNDELANHLHVSYVAVTALTGVPLMVSALAGVTSLTASKIWGRRPVYLGSMISILIGLVWNTQIRTSYAQFMAARIFQGLGWGAFDTTIVGTIMDTYFEHERSKKLAFFRIVSVATTWGPPMLGGVVSQNAIGINLQFEILAFLQIITIPLVIFGAPETMYRRALPLGKSRSTSHCDWTPHTGLSSIGLKSSCRFQRLPAWARGRGMTFNRIVQYIKEVAPPRSYVGAPVDDDSALQQTLRTLIAPTTVLSFLASFLPFSLLWGISSSLSGILTRQPLDLPSVTIGVLFATPFILSTLAVAIFTLWPAWYHTNTAFSVSTTHLSVLAGGAALSFAGLLGLGLESFDSTTPTPTPTPAPHPAAAMSPLDGPHLSVLSVLLGLVAAGAYVLDAPTKPLISLSVRFTAPSLFLSLRTLADMSAGVTFWKTLAAGVFSMAIPAVAVAPAGSSFRTTGVTVAVVQVFVAGAVGAAWYLWEDILRGADGRVLAYVDISFMRGLRSPKSFFEHD